MKSKTLEEIKKFTREQLKNLLSQCTEEQQTFFYKMYPLIDEIPLEKISWAIKQCENTIAKNLNDSKIESM